VVSFLHVLGLTWSINFSLLQCVPHAMSVFSSIRSLYCYRICWRVQIAGLSTVQFLRSPVTSTLLDQFASTLFSHYLKLFFSLDKSPRVTHTKQLFNFNLYAFCTVYRKRGTSYGPVISLPHLSAGVLLSSSTNYTFCHITREQLNKFSYNLKQRLCHWRFVYSRTP
jgi:hypothetical protein